MMFAVVFFYRDYVHNLIHKFNVHNKVHENKNFVDLFFIKIETTYYIFRLFLFRNSFV